MPHAKLNYVVVFKNDSQVYGSTSKEVALTSPLPKHTKLEDKRVLFISYDPDEEELNVHPIPQSEVEGAELKDQK